MLTALILCRFVHFAATMLIFGALSYRRVLAIPPAVVEGDAWAGHSQRALFVAGVLSLVSAAGWLAAESAQMSGEPSGAYDPQTLWLVLSDTDFGAIWTWRLLLAGGVLFSLCGRREWMLRLQLPLSFLLLATLGFVGHAAMETGFAGFVHRTSHAIHLLSGGAWVGGLAYLVFILTEAKAAVDAEAKVQALRRFSFFGYAAVGLVLISGGANSLFLIGNADSLGSTAFGRTLSVKLVLVGGMLILAGVHRLVLLPRSMKASSPAGRFARSLALEMAIAVLVVAVASVLGTLPPAG